MTTAIVGALTSGHTCFAAGCDRPVYARCFCRVHYRQHRKWKLTGMRGLPFTDGHKGARPLCIEPAPRARPVIEWGVAGLYTRSIPCANPECAGGTKHSGWTVALCDGRLLYLCDSGSYLLCYTERPEPAP